MNPLIKSLGVVALGGIFAGSAVAGPGDAYSYYSPQTAQNTGQVQVALFRASANKQANVETKIVPGANQKSGALTTVQATSRAVSK
ncbi:MAG: hypothetical protein WC003_02180 [Terrimicrobiaceae bacterium]